MGQYWSKIKAKVKGEQKETNGIQGIGNRRKVGDIRNACANNPKLDFFINVVIIKIRKQFTRFSKKEIN